MQTVCFCSNKKKQLYEKCTICDNIKDDNNIIVAVLVSFFIICFFGTIINSTFEKFGYTDFQPISLVASLIINLIFIKYGFYDCSHKYKKMVYFSCCNRNEQYNGP